MLHARLMAATTASALLLGLAALPAAAQQRPEVNGTEAAVTSDHPLATAAGAEMLRRGGNAVDAAVTTAAVLAVVRPHMNGVGGDAFLLIRDARSGEVHALNGSGRSGSRATPEFFRERGLDEVPSTGPQSVSVPGAVRAWADALDRFGTITLAEALAPAIRYAAEGFPVSEKLAADIAASRRGLARDPAMAEIFLPGGEPPEPGTTLRQPDLARTLRRIASDGPDAFYRGEIADRIVSFLEAEDGLLTRADLADHTSTWTRPISTDYLGYRVLAFPPNTQGLALLAQMNMAEHFDLAAMGHNTPEYVHTLVEIKKLAFEDRDRHVTDPEFADIPVDRLTSKDYAAERVRPLRRATSRTETEAPDAVRVASEAVVHPGPPVRGGAARTNEEEDEGRDGDGDTVYLAVVDQDGNAVSLIESLFNAFGSGRMVPGTGIVLQNRGALVSLDPDHPNIVAPGKRPYHTLSPAMVLNEDGSLFMVVGTPGGDGQTQTITQIFHNVVLFGMTPQRAIEAPRWRSFDGNRLSLEPALGEAVGAVLEARGHEVRVQSPGATFGGAQIILRHPATGALMTGADYRREAYGIAW